MLTSMPESLGLVRAPWFGQAVALALLVTAGRAIYCWLDDVAARLLARRARVYSHPSHIRERLAADARATARRWR